MEVGYDYLLLRSRLQQRLFRASGILLLITGGILLTAGITYLVYAQVARSGLGELEYVVPVVPQTIGEGAATTFSGPVVTSQGATELYVAPSAELQTIRATLGEVFQPISEESSPSLGQPQAVPRVEPGSQSLMLPLSQDPSSQVSPSAIAGQQLYPGEAIKATYWNNPLEYEPASYAESSLIQGFKPIDTSLVAPLGTLSAPTRIILPSIGVDSEVAGLQVLDLGDSRAYETPKNLVGHIPQSANPGEGGSGWFFGHLESPIAGEGNVFYNLPQIPDLLRQGQEVYAIVENGKTSYLYQITETKVVHQNDMQLYDGGDPNIHLVVCVPKLVYDHRLIVTGKLVGIHK
jgi:LPXTG-site transpeptidase (sortase) family protein